MTDILEFEIVEPIDTNAPERTTVELTIRLDKINEIESAHEVLSIVNTWKADVSISHTDYRYSNWRIKLTSTATQCEGFAKALEKYNQTN
jgi:hypothetical protein